MNDAIDAMLRTYGRIETKRDEDNALKEVIQRLVLMGLYRGKFFEKACFYGGTGLRLLYGLDRFSEDLDFCLIEADPFFNLKAYFSPIRDELERYGFAVRLEEKKTGLDVAIESAFVKQDVSSGLLLIGKDNKRAQKGQVVKIKVEVDKTNPPGFKMEKKLIKLPTPFLLTTLSEGSLFAGKLHALIARAYLNRVKGRDYYDFLFYASRGTKVNLTYLEAKLRDSEHYVQIPPLDRMTMIGILNKKFMSVDFEKAKSDVMPFISLNRQSDLHDWCAELFIAIAKDLDVEPLA